MCSCPLRWNSVILSWKTTTGPFWLEIKHCDAIVEHCDSTVKYWNVRDNHCNGTVYYYCYIVEDHYNMECDYCDSSAGSYKWIFDHCNGPVENYDETVNYYNGTEKQCIRATLHSDAIVGQW